MDDERSINYTQPIEFYNFSSKTTRINGVPEEHRSFLKSKVMLSCG